MKKVLISIIISVFSSIIIGCVADRDVLDIPSPIVEPTKEKPNKEIFIVVIDKRVFETKPYSPSTPSLAPNQEQTDEVKARAIGRKRNTLGKALGDIVLKQGQSVKQLIADTVCKVFIENGYKVITRKEDITKNTLLLRVEINNFWAWMNYNFALRDIRATIVTSITARLPLKGKIGKTISLDTTAVETYETTKEQNTKKFKSSYQTSKEYTEEVNQNFVEVINLVLSYYISDLRRNFSRLEEAKNE